MKTQTQNTLTALQNLYFSENKPDWLQPIDVALVTYLLLRQTEDHAIFDSQDTLAQRLGCERKTVGRAIARLGEKGWITIQKPMQWSGKTKRRSRALAKTLGLSVNPNKLPQATDRAKRTAKPSEVAKDLATQHTAIVRYHGKGRRLPNNFAAQQAHAAQRLIDEIGDADIAIELVNFAVEDERFTAAATRSLYQLRLRLKPILAAFTQAQSQGLRSE